MARPQHPDTLAAFGRLIVDMPMIDAEAIEKTRAREAVLTKPAGALGRLEQLTEWLAGWQGRHPGEVKRVLVAVFAGNHGVAAQGVSAYPADVTAQMVINFETGGAAINQLAGELDAELRITPMSLDVPVHDISHAAAMSEADCVEAICTGMTAVQDSPDLLCLGEMGIANTTAASAIAAMLMGGDGMKWAGPGTGVAGDALTRKRKVIDAALDRHAQARGAPLEVLRSLGGREFAAIAGAVVAARYLRVPVLLDGFACTVAAAVVQAMRPDGLDHCQIAHCSAEPGHALFLKALDRTPLLDLGMRLGEGSGAALAALLVRAAARTHAGMASFGEAGVSGPAD